MSGTHSILWRSAVVTGMATAATFCLFFLIRWATAEPYTWVNLLECAIIPVAVGMPIVSFLFVQSDRLSAAYERLAAATRKIECGRDELLRANERLFFAATHDQMTGMLNRDTFMTAVETRLGAGATCALLMIDADNFKVINDSFGHLIGDNALREIASVLKGAVGNDDAVGRIGGEEFGVLVAGGPARAECVAEKIRRGVSDIPWGLISSSGKSSLSVSIGGTLLEHGAGVTAYLNRADSCLYQAKRRGRDRCIFDWDDLVETDDHSWRFKNRA